MHGEFFKLLDEKSITWLTKVFNNIYSVGKLPTQWLKYTFIALPKKPSTRHCNDFALFV